MRPYDLTPRAYRDLESIRRSYDRKSANLGNQFIDAFLFTLTEVRERPLSFPQVDDETRGARVRRFPYRIYFEIGEDDSIVVKAVYHTARDPRRWDDEDRE